MTLNNWAFIYLGTGEEDPAVDRAVIELLRMNYDRAKARNERRSLNPTSENAS